MKTSSDLRKYQPLRPVHIGLIGSQVVGLWHNWERLSIRCLQGKELFSWESTHGLIHEARIIGGAYLFVTLGFGVSLHHFRVYTFAHRQWGPLHSICATDYAVLGIHPSQPFVGIQNAGKTELWDLHTECKIHTWDIELECMDLSPEGHLIGSHFEAIVWTQSEQVKLLACPLSLDERTALQWLYPPIYFVMGYASGRVSLYNIHTLQEEPLLHCGEEITSIYVARDPTWFALQTSTQTWIHHLGKQQTHILTDSYGLFEEPLHQKRIQLKASEICIIQ